MKKRGLGVLIAVLALVFVISSCVLFKGTPVGKKWKGTVNLTTAAGQVAAGPYNVSITLEFEWLFGNSKIIGGQVTLTPALAAGKRAGSGSAGSGKDGSGNRMVGALGLEPRTSTV